MLIDRLEVSYCEGWDPETRTTAGLLSAARAAERDRAGEQYAVLLSVAGQPLVIVEVAWLAGTCGVWFLDAQRRRALMADCRLLAEDRLFVRGGRQWVYAGPDDPEFDDDVTHGEYQRRVDGPRGGGSTSRGNKNPDLWLDMAQPPDAWLDVPAFGAWERFLRAFPEHLAVLGYELSSSVRLEDVSDPGGTGLPSEQWPWHPPRPLQPPAYLDLLFRPGTRLEVDSSEAVEDVGGTVAVEVPHLGTLRMPSGALIACDPAYLRPIEPEIGEWATKYWSDEQSRQPFTVTVPPGDYPVVLSRFRWLRGSGQVEAAVKVWVSDGPVDRWEMALRAGDDPRTLADGGFFGFGVDAGKGCFFDAAAASALARQPTEFTLECGQSRELTDDASGANLIAYHSGGGDGHYPVWIGRTAAGDVACFVADMLTFDIMTVISPRA
jgi:Protein of unknown function (DUF4241)